MKYTRAFQDSNCTEVIAHVPWMREHLAHTAMETGDTAARAQAKEKLCAKILRRGPEGNQIQFEGIEDAYLFCPGASISVSGTDEGRHDLEAPVHERVWLDIVYPSRAMAPMSPSGEPVHRLRAGLNLSTEGQILKASVLGNVEIDFDSIDTDW